MYVFCSITLCVGLSVCVPFRVYLSSICVYVGLFPSLFVYLTKIIKLLERSLATARLEGRKTSATNREEEEAGREKMGG